MFRIPPPFPQFGKAAVAALACALLAVTPARADDLPDVRRNPMTDAIADVMPSVVNVATERIVATRDPFADFFNQFYGDPMVLHNNSSLGSGVIISEDGYILTNLHVVNRATRIQVKLSDEAGGGVYDVQPVYVGQTDIDIAVLKIIPKAKGEKFKAIKFAKDDDLILGETVIALGNPFGLGESVTSGILSSKRRATPKANEPLGMANWLQTDAQINPGNSGGPLIDLRGNLIGINTAILQEGQGIGFAIPIKEVRQALAEILAPETASRWFGAHFRHEGPPEITDIDAGSPADKAGLKPGDAIVEINGSKTADFLEIDRRLRDETNLDFNLAYQRDSTRHETNLHLVPLRELFKRWTGADIQELTPALVDQLGLAAIGGAETGLLISGVEKGSPADAASFQDYFIITGVNGTPVHNYPNLFLLLSRIGKGGTARISLLIPRTRGDLILSYQPGRAALKLR